MKVASPGNIHKLLFMLGNNYVNTYRHSLLLASTGVQGRGSRDSPTSYSATRLVASTSRYLLYSLLEGTYFALLPSRRYLLRYSTPY